MPKVKGDCLAIGTGGNIGKLFDLADHRTDEHRMSRKVLKEVLERVEKLDYDGRIRDLGLKPDRADVIVPAGRIYSQVMKWANCKEILIPNLGVSDGILEELFLGSKA
jgi:exopolyphosphatase/guanosine-5'-triphosphate,3'-diphosphate pyrophosphatase